MFEQDGEQRQAGQPETPEYTQPGMPTERVGQTVEQSAEAIRRTVDQQRLAAARDLEQAAQRIRQTAAHTQGLVRQYAEQAARRLDAGAAFLRETPVPEMAKGFERTVREHPLPSLGAAVIVGFLLARIFR